jgi:hypothetical protein
VSRVSAAHHQQAHAFRTAGPGGELRLSRTTCRGPDPARRSPVHPTDPFGETQFAVNPEHGPVAPPGGRASCSSPPGSACRARGCAGPSRCRSRPGSA